MLIVRAMHSMMIRCVVVDDEEWLRVMARNMLGKHRDVDLVGEFATGEEFLEGVQALRPDLVLMDVEPGGGLDGFDTLRRMPPDCHPLVVFLTGFSEYAVDAFEVRALDYLVKDENFDKPPFDKMLYRARGRLRERADAQWAREMTSQIVKRPAIEDEEDICWFEASGNDAFVHLSDGTKREMGESLKELEERLDPKCYFRIHRSAIVNADKIRYLDPLRAGDFLVHLRSGVQLRLSRRYRENMQPRLFN